MAAFEVAALLWDLDGVLVLSTRSVERAWRWWAERRGLVWSRVRPQVHGRLAVDTIRRVLPDLPAEDVEREAAAVNRRQIVDTGDLVPTPGARSLLSTLPPDRWAVVTGCPRELAQARLRAAELPRPGALVSAEDVELGKPSPEGYRLAAGLLRVPVSACLVVEDSPSGILAARSAGMPVTALSTTHAVERLRSADAVVPDVTWMQVRVGRGGAMSVTLRPPRRHSG